MTQNESEPSDADIEALLRATGARSAIAPAVTEEVRRAVHAEWQVATRVHNSGRRAVVFGIAASVAAAAAALFIVLRSVSLPPPVAVAVLERMVGTVIMESTDDPGPVQAGRVILTGDTLATRADALAALRIAKGISVRLDGNTTLAVLAPDRVALRAGAIYVDAGPAGTQAPTLEVDTAAGRVRHLGTQYQIRSDGRDVTVSVREGRVELRLERGNQAADAGEKVVVSSRGEVLRSEVPPHDASWAWATQIAPPFQIESQPLTAFLQWAARETGRTLVYASPDVELAAAGVTLHGSTANLTPEAALAAVLSTTQLEHLVAEGGLIRIARRARAP